jgi:hypothetical protein
MEATVPDIEDSPRDGYPQCSCKKCRRTCSETPGFFDPAHLNNMQPEDLPLGFRENLIEDFVCEDDDFLSDAIMFVRPRTVRERPWSIADPILLDAACAFLGEDGCTLPRDLMPIDCLATFGCDHPDARTPKPDVVREWNTRKGKLVAMLYEGEARQNKPDAIVGKKGLIERDKEQKDMATFAGGFGSLRLSEDDDDSDDMESDE